MSIAASPERVWEVLTDLASYREWHPHLALLDSASDVRLAPGAMIRMRLSGGVAGDHDFTANVTLVTPPSVLEWEGGDRERFWGRHRWTLTPTGSGTDVLDEEIFSGTLAEAIVVEHLDAMRVDYDAIAAALKSTAEA